MGWLVAGSIVLAVVSLLALPTILIFLPADYFVRRHRQPDAWHGASSVTRLAVILGKNLLGAVLVVAGIVMLVTPGQGVLCILLGVLMLDFPGKERVEQRILGNEKIQSALNTIRAKAGRKPLELPDEESADTDDGQDGDRRATPKV